MKSRIYCICGIFKSFHFDVFIFVDTMTLYVKSTFVIHFPALQCISPGIVETEFAFRHHNSDPEKAASVYESMKVRLCTSLKSTNVKLSICCYANKIFSLCFAVFESRRHSQCSHICPQRPSSRPGISVCLGLLQY